MSLGALYFLKMVFSPFSAIFDVQRLTVPHCANLKSNLNRFFYLKWAFFMKRDNFVGEIESNSGSWNVFISKLIIFRQKRQTKWTLSKTLSNFKCYKINISAVASRGDDSVTAAEMGLALTYAQTITQTLNFLIRVTAELEVNVRYENLWHDMSHGVTWWVTWWAEGAISRDYVICDVTFYELNSPIPQSRQIPNRGIVTQDYRKASLNMQFLYFYALRMGAKEMNAVMLKWPQVDLIWPFRLDFFKIEIVQN